MTAGSAVTIAAMNNPGTPACKPAFSPPAHMISAIHVTMIIDAARSLGLAGLSGHEPTFIVRNIARSLAEECGCGRQRSQVAGRTQESQSPLTRAGDKVQVMSAIGAVQSGGHDKPTVSAASYPSLHQTQGWGTHSFETGGKEVKMRGRATRPQYAKSGAPTFHVATGEFKRPGHPSSGKIMRRLLRELASSGEVKGDTTTLEDFGVR